MTANTWEAQNPSPETPTWEMLGQQVDTVLAHLRQEFPTWNAQRLFNPGEVCTPRQRHPLFYGSYDWHSNVHSHWALLRVANMVAGGAPGEPVGSGIGEDTLDAVVGALRGTFTDRDSVAAETEYWGAGMGQQMPYGATWFLQLCSELRDSPLPEARVWLGGVRALESVIAGHAVAWMWDLCLADRSGQHANSAWSLMLLHEWALKAGEPAVAAETSAVVWRLFAADRDAPVLFEPSAHDFFSPSLTEAAVVCRTQPTERAVGWLRGFLPGWFTPGGGVWLPEPPSGVSEDYRRAHLAGLPFTRCIALHRVASVFEQGSASDGGVGAVVRQEAARQLDRGLRQQTGGHYSAEHWVSSYLIQAVSEPTQSGASGVLPR